MESAKCDTLLTFQCLGYQNARLSSLFQKIAPLSGNTAGNRCNRRPLAGRLRDPETSIRATPLAKSTKTNLQEGQIRETFVTFRSPRAINCDTVLKFSFFWTLQLCGKRENAILSSLSMPRVPKCETVVTFSENCTTLREYRRQPLQPPPLSR